MNNFSCTARLGNDCEVRQTQGGTSICTFSGAVDSGYGDRKTTMWVRLAIFGKRSEGKLPDYLRKGTQVAVCGELSLNTWQNKDGVEKASLECNVGSLDLIGGQSNNDQPPVDRGTSGDGGGTGDDVPF